MKVVDHIGKRGAAPYERYAAADIGLDESAKMSRHGPAVLCDKNKCRRDLQNFIVR